ncbi:hypothetical protein ACHAXM_007363 [Skeletonema potamos]
MLERLQFSIPITITIEAPVDIVWNAISDLPSYPSFLSSCVSVVPQPNNTSTTSKGSNKSTRENNNIPTDTLVERNTPFLGSRWKITRISVLENQTYGAPVTITQHSVTETSRILTFSTHEMLGATCSLKLTLEKADAAASLAIDDSANNRGDISSNRGGNGGGRSERRDSGASAASSTKQQASLLEGKEACQLTAIMTMIPYQFFVKLLGVMCCICLLKWRARIAMECDLEDVTAYCEGKYQEQLESQLRAEQLEEGGASDLNNLDSYLEESDKADAARGVGVESE